MKRLWHKKFGHGAGRVDGCPEVLQGSDGWIVQVSLLARLVVAVFIVDCVVN